MKLFVVIPNWNGADMLLECLQSLKEQTVVHQVIVVDNGSEDDSVQLVKKQFPETIILQNDRNLGFTGGVNPGISYALEHDGDAVALLNNDAIADKNWLKNLANTLQKHDDTGIVTSKILRDDKQYLDSTGDFYSVWGIPFPRGRNTVDEGQFDKDVSVFSASGGASLYRANMLQQIGIFDHRFFAYYEDVDISFRAQLAGWRVRYEPKSIVYHAVNATSSKMGDFTRYHSIKNFLILYTKDMPAQLYWKYFPYFFYQFLRTTARSFLDKKPHVWLRSLGTFLWMLPGILVDRHQIQKNRKVNAKHIENLLYTSRPPKIPVIIGDKK